MARIAPPATSPVAKLYEEGRQFEAALFRSSVADPVLQSAF